MSAERGWIVEPPPNPPATPPSHRYKWYKMMGKTHLIPLQEREAMRRAGAQYIVEIQAEQERKNAELPDLTGQPTLQVAERYATGRPR